MAAPRFFIFAFIYRRKLSPSCGNGTKGDFFFAFIYRRGCACGVRLCFCAVQLPCATISSGGILWAKIAKYLFLLRNREKMYLRE